MVPQHFQILSGKFWLNSPTHITWQPPPTADPLQKYLCFDSAEHLKPAGFCSDPSISKALGTDHPVQKGSPSFLAFQAVCTPNPHSCPASGVSPGSPWGCGWGMWCWGNQTPCSSAGIAESKPFLLPSQMCFGSICFCPAGIEWKQWLCHYISTSV